MTSSAKMTTTVSANGQVTLPKAVLERLKWGAGTRLIVEETYEGVFLRAAPLFASTIIDEVYGSLKWSGPAKSIEEMDQAVLDEALRRHDRGREGRRS